MAIKADKTVHPYGITVKGLYIRVVEFEVRFPTDEYFLAQVYVYKNKDAREKDEVIDQYHIDLPIKVFEKINFNLDDMLTATYNWIKENDTVLKNMTDI